jgi:hypothetical protein
VGGILGAIMGYDRIPEKWLDAYKEIEDVTLNYTTVTLSDCYDICLASCLENITEHGGTVDGDEITISYREAGTLPLEVAYPDLYPSGTISLEKPIQELGVIEFSGTGIVVLGGPTGQMLRRIEEQMDYTAEIEVNLDGEKIAVRKLPYNYHDRAQEVYFNLQLEEGDHTLELNWLNPEAGLELPIEQCIKYSGELVKMDPA